MCKIILIADLIFARGGQTVGEGVAERGQGGAKWMGQGDWARGVG